MTVYPTQHPDLTDDHLATFAAFECPPSADQTSPVYHLFLALKYMAEELLERRRLAEADLQPANHYAYAGPASPFIEALKFDERIWRAFLSLKSIHREGLLEELAKAAGKEHTP